MSIAFNISIAQIPMSIEGSGENKLTDVDLGGSFRRYFGPLHGEHVTGKHFQYLWRIRNLQCVSLSGYHNVPHQKGPRITDIGQIRIIRSGGWGFGGSRFVVTMVMIAWVAAVV
jgi:hypothetical protein